MRLIKAETWALETFNPNKVPPYAILSHTWGDSEVSLQDFEALQQASRSQAFSAREYTKLRGCATQTLKQKYRHFWIDTCCIDSKSSAELSEAINSMYKWYQGAEVCFVYLSDVSAHQLGEATLVQGLDLEGIRREHLREEFRASRWFSRGWTLQELLAPTHVVFFSKEWIELGTKDSMCSEIFDLCGIPPSVLNGTVNLNDMSVARRMSWAGDRYTTRPEDIAYSLFGIFGINMPLLYGEGGPNAFLRLQEEIIKKSDDQSVFVWAAPVDEARSLTSTSTRGPFAESPRDFGGARFVAGFASYANYPFFTTNKGLQLTAPLCRGDESTPTYVLLRCCNQDDGHPLALPLLEVPDTADEFVRVAEWSPFPVRQRRQIPVIETIFIKWAWSGGRLSHSVMKRMSKLVNSEDGENDQSENNGVSIRSSVAAFYDEHLDWEPTLTVDDRNDHIAALNAIQGPSNGLSSQSQLPELLLFDLENLVESGSGFSLLQSYPVGDINTSGLLQLRAERPDGNSSNGDWRRAGFLFDCGFGQIAVLVCGIHPDAGAWCDAAWSSSIRARDVDLRSRTLLTPRPHALKRNVDLIACSRGTSFGLRVSVTANILTATPRTEHVAIQVRSWSENLEIEESKPAIRTRRKLGDFRASKRLLTISMPQLRLSRSVSHDLSQIVGHRFRKSQ